MEIRKIYISILLLTLCNLGFAQLIRLETADLTNISHKGDSIYLKYNAPTTMRALFMLSKPANDPWASLPVKGEVKMFYYKDNQEVVLVTESFTNAAWPSGGAFSKIIEKNFTVPANTVTPSNPIIDVQARWRYYKEGYPHPYNNNGWTEWHYTNTRPFVLNPNEIPPTVFNGPSFICGEGIFTITNPYNISLLNASGIASLTALGNNQWKITKIGNANARVILRSTAGLKAFSKEIAIGSPTYKDITNGFEGNLGPGGIYDFELKPGFEMDSYDWSVIGGTILSGKNSSTVKVRIDMNPYNALNNFSIMLNYTGGCGAGTVSASRYVNSSGSGGGGDTPIDYGETGE